MVWVITHPARDTRSRPQPGSLGDQAGKRGEDAASSTAPGTAQQRRRVRLACLRPQHLDRVLLSVSGLASSGISANPASQASMPVTAAWVSPRVCGEHDVVLADRQGSFPRVQKQVKISRAT